MKRPARIILLGACALSLISAPALHAATFDFHVTLNVSSLIGKPNAPFLLDFQLNEGSGTLPNSVTLTNFLFTGGAATGTAFGNGSGSLTTSVNLNDNSTSPFIEFYQGFSASTTKIGFNVSLSQNVPGVSPDGFSASILDSEGGNPQIGTNAPDGVSLIIVPIKSADTLADVATFSSTSPSGVTAAASVPEPGCAVSLLGGVALLLARRPRRGR